ncbi:phosphoenolpyruvate--protein phosphotransferase [Paracoccaceae bacterium GXU_MW_L88]
MSPMRGEDSSRALLRRLRSVLAEPIEGQTRLDRITGLIADGLGANVCSIYLRRDDTTLELCATEGLSPDAVHQTRLRVGQGLVGTIAETATPLRTPEAPHHPNFRYMPETQEDAYHGFLGVPVQRLGEVLGVLVVQDASPREYTDDDIYVLEVIAMVLAEMAELGAFVDEGGAMALHQRPFFSPARPAQEGIAEGTVLLHEPRLSFSQPVADDPEEEDKRLMGAVEALRAEVDQMLQGETPMQDQEYTDILHSYRMFAHDKGWLARMRASVESGLSAEVAVEREQSATRARMERLKDPYLKARLSDLDDVANRLLKHLSGVSSPAEREIPEDAILVARNIGPAELLDYGKKIRGVVLEDGAVGAHATIVARALAIPLVVQAKNILREAINGDAILIDADIGAVHLRPDDAVRRAFNEKMAMRAEAQEAYAALRDVPAVTRDGTRIGMMMNAGLLADLPSLEGSGAEGVGLFRTELQFLTRQTVPKRAHQARLYAHIISRAGERPVVFRTLDIGSDKVLPYMKRNEEPNPALGWRAIRVGLDRKNLMRMQIQALIRGAKGRPLSVLLPFVAEPSEYYAGREIIEAEIAREARIGNPVPESVKIGAMLETPSLAFAPESFFRAVDFLSIGGNDLKQFFFAADRENERVRSRYDMLSTSFLRFIEEITRRASVCDTPVSFCGEDAGKPLDAVALAAMGLRSLSMRPASIGPVKFVLRQVTLKDVERVIKDVRAAGEGNVRSALLEHLRGRGVTLPPTLRDS